MFISFLPLSHFLYRVFAISSHLLLLDVSPKPYKVTFLCLLSYFTWLQTSAAVPEGLSSDMQFFFIKAIPLCDNISILYIPVLHNNLH